MRTPKAERRVVQIRSIDAETWEWVLAEARCRHWKVAAVIEAAVAVYRSEIRSEVA